MVSSEEKSIVGIEWIIFQFLLGMVWIFVRDRLTGLTFRTAIHLPITINRIDWALAIHCFSPVKTIIRLEFWKLFRIRFSWCAFLSFSLLLTKKHKELSFVFR